VSTPNDRDTAAQEPDPTGVRALLAALPDPGPMPAEVTARITASLQRAQEQRNRASGATPAVSSLPQRRRSRAPHVLAAAASVAAVALAGVVLLDQVVGDGSLGDMAAVYRGSTGSAGSAADEAGRGEAMADAGGGGDNSAATVQADPQSDQLEANSLPGDLRVVSVPEPMSTPTFAVGVSSALAAAETGPADTNAASNGAGLSVSTAQACVEATGEEVAAQTWTVSAITLDGDDAVLVVAAGDPNQAWALGPECALGDDSADIRLGPVDLP